VLSALFPNPPVPQPRLGDLDQEALIALTLAEWTVAQRSRLPEAVADFDGDDHEFFINLFNLWLTLETRVRNILVADHRRRPLFECTFRFRAHPVIDRPMHILGFIG